MSYLVAYTLFLPVPHQDNKPRKNANERVGCLVSRSLTSIFDVENLP